MNKVAPEQIDIANKDMLNECAAEIVMRWERVSSVNHLGLKVDFWYYDKRMKMIIADSQWGPATDRNTLSRVLVTAEARWEDMFTKAFETFLLNNTSSLRLLTCHPEEILRAALKAAYICINRSNEEDE